MDAIACCLYDYAINANRRLYDHADVLVFKVHPNDHRNPQQKNPAAEEPAADDLADIVISATSQ